MSDHTSNTPSKVIHGYHFFNELGVLIGGIVAMSNVYLRTTVANLLMNVFIISACDEQLCIFWCWCFSYFKLPSTATISSMAICTPSDKQGIILILKISYFLCETILTVHSFWLLWIWSYLSSVLLIHTCR